MTEQAKQELLPVPVDVACPSCGAGNMVRVVSWLSETRHVFGVTVSPEGFPTIETEDDISPDYDSANYAVDTSGRPEFTCRHCGHTWHPDIRTGGHLVTFVNEAGKGVPTERVISLLNANGEIDRLRVLHERIGQVVEAWDKAAEKDRGKPHMASGGDVTKCPHCGGTEVYLIQVLFERHYVNGVDDMGDLEVGLMEEIEGAGDREVDENGRAVFHCDECAHEWTHADHIGGIYTDFRSGAAA
jgi:DNA-directed RNA polymerase subunit M/transcription elongation factor TFIIS